jgi:hypothetical protein
MYQAGQARQIEEAGHEVHLIYQYVHIHERYSTTTDKMFQNQISYLYRDNPKMNWLIGFFSLRPKHSLRSYGLIMERLY